MIIVVLKNPEPQNIRRKGVNSEVRVLIEGLDDDDADKFGAAIHDFATSMKREFTAFRLEPEMVPR